MSPDRDLERVICPLHELADPGAKGCTMGGGDWPLRGFDVRRGKTVRVAQGYVMLEDGVPLEEPADLGR